MLSSSRPNCCFFLCIANYCSGNYLGTIPARMGSPVHVKRICLSYVPWKHPLFSIRMPTKQSSSDTI
uniref:Putative secreted protein n=1 Tax=Anopheles triannulatus TaxID=58253 RepID=A0A2M4B142_9DIPT